MDTIETNFDFEELAITICGKFATGMMIYGTAVLTGDDDGFYVSAIELEGGTMLKRSGNGYLGFPALFEGELFARIAAVIENPKTHIGKLASDTWDEAREEAREGT